MSAFEKEMENARVRLMGGRVAEYKRMHVPTGEVSVCRFGLPEEGVALHRSTALELVNGWNRQGRDLWRYWID